MSDHLSTQELINRIEIKDRRFRTAQAIFLTLLLSLLIGVVFVQFRTLDTVRQQLATSKTTAAETQKQSEEQRKVIIRRLDCMVAFFSQNNRENLTIKDIEKCSLEQSDPTKFFAPADSTTSETNKNADGSETTTTTTQTTPGNPGAINNKKLPITPLSKPPVIEPRPPIKLFGLPICIPFTEVCVR